MIRIPATSAGSSGGADPPQNQRRLPAYCESVLYARNRGKGKRKKTGQNKGRGKAKGVDIAAYVATRGKLKVSFETDEQTWKAVGPHATWFDSAIGIITRECCDPSYNYWSEVPPQQKAAIRERMLLWFDVDMSDIMREVLDRDAQQAYKEWKGHLSRYFKKFDDIKEALANKHETVRTPEEWQRCCDRFLSPKFKEMSRRNIKNRAANKTPSHHGRKSYVRIRMDKADPETKKMYSAIENWKDMRTPGGKWVNDQAKEKYDTMTERQHTQTTCKEKVIMEETLGKRRGRQSGIGPALSQSRCRHAEAQSVAGTSTTRNLRLERRYRKLKDKLSRLERVIERLAPDDLSSSDGYTSSSSSDAQNPHDRDEDEEAAYERGEEAEYDADDDIDLR